MSMKCKNCGKSEKEHFEGSQLWCSADKGDVRFFNPEPEVEKL